MEMHVLSQYKIFKTVDKEQGKLIEILEGNLTCLKYGE